MPKGVMSRNPRSRGSGRHHPINSQVGLSQSSLGHRLGDLIESREVVLAARFFLPVFDPFLCVTFFTSNLSTQTPIQPRVARWNVCTRGNRSVRFLSLVRLCNGEREKTSYGHQSRTFPP